MNPRERFLNACRKRPVDRPPVWLMRQAGRYLPEYRLIRAQHDFIEMCRTPEIACEVSLQPWQRYKMDAVIVFSDILFVPDAMGLKLTFKKLESERGSGFASPSERGMGGRSESASESFPPFDAGPKLSPILKSGDDLNLLKTVDAKSAFSFVYEAIRLLKRKLPKDVPVIGFSGAPWTLACYMMDIVGENSGARRGAPLRRGGALSAPKMKGAPPMPDDSLHKLLDMIAEAVTDYVRLQQEAGCDVIQLFDTWAGELSTENFKKFSAPYIKRIIAAGRTSAPFIIYSRTCSHILNELADTGADVISIDSETKMEDAIKKIGGSLAIQGNIDPKTLLTTPGVVRQETSRLLSKIRGRNGHIINLGHGVLQTTPLECVEAFVETVKAFQ